MSFGNFSFIFAWFESNFIFVILRNFHAEFEHSFIKFHLLAMFETLFEISIDFAIVFGLFEKQWSKIQPILMIFREKCQNFH